MKMKILSIEGKEIKEITLPEIFSSKIREDIAQKVYEAGKMQQPYAPFYLAGKQYSASGKIRHSRRLWKTAYGHGISRVPRKILWRRGTQFYWIGAGIASARGGKRAHPPKIEHFLKKKKINKKEKKLALFSALSATASEKYVKKRYETLQDKKLELPLIVESKILQLKTKEFFSALKKILEGYEFGKKEKRLLFVMGKEEEFKTKLIEVKKADELSMQDLFPLGRLVIYTENAIKQLGESKYKEKEK